MPTNSVVAPSYGSRQSAYVLDTDELLQRLEERGVRNVDIARTLGLPDSRVPEIRRKERALKLEEAVKLVRAYSLEQGQEVSAIPSPIARLVVRYIAAELGVGPDDQRVLDLAEDVRAFAEFVADPKVRQSAEAAEAFFQAMRLRRPKVGETGRSEIDPEQAH